MSSLTMARSAPAEPRVIDWRRFALVGVGTVLAAVLANLIVYVIGGAIVGYDPGFVVLATTGGTILFTVVPANLAVLLYAVLLRFTDNPARIFSAIAAIVLIVSWIPDLTYIPTVPGSSGVQTAVLMAMHAVAAVVIVAMLTTLARPQRR